MRQPWIEPSCSSLASPHSKCCIAELLLRAGLIHTSSKHQIFTCLQIPREPCSEQTLWMQRWPQSKWWNNTIWYCHIIIQMYMVSSRLLPPSYHRGIRQIQGCFMHGTGAGTPSSNLMVCVAVSRPDSPLRRLEQLGGYHYQGRWPVQEGNPDPMWGSQSVMC